MSGRFSPSVSGLGPASGPPGALLSGFSGRPLRGRRYLLMTQLPYTESACRPAAGK